MKNNVKKIISVFLVALMLFGVIPMSAFAAETTTPTVKIVSFMRGEQTDLRSSELLEARVTGYDGNVRELTYEWTNTLGTYLYVYNSHNMYGINNTDGEQEIYNKNVSSSENMIGRSHKDTFSGKGYAWAAVYGASLKNLNSKNGNSLVGTVTVKVYDNGVLLCSDTHEGKYSSGKLSGFVNYNLQNDMDNVVIGMFVGDKKNVLDLLGESAVVHITCTASAVADGKVKSGSTYIKLTKDGDYFIEGVEAGTSTASNGDAQVELKIKKSNCKFHNESSGTATTTVFVFEKPKSTTTTTTLTLNSDSLDERCRYFINGVEGTKQDDGSIIFTGLTPNTNYTVEVEAEYKDNEGKTKYAYAFIYDTTKPVYSATVYTYLDHVLTDISDIHGEDVTLYLHDQSIEGVHDHIELQRTETGTYTATVVNGIYYPWHVEAGDHEHMAKEYKLIIENANGELALHHYSVTYNTNDGAFADGETSAKEVYSSMKKVEAIDAVPTRDGYVFAGWEYDGKTYNAGEEITSAISDSMTLEAKWVKEVNVTINVTIDHMYNGGYDHDEDRAELVVDFLEMKEGSPAFIETGDKLYFSKDGVIDENGNEKPYLCEDKMSASEVKTIYTATGVTYSGLLETSYFGVAVSKSGYNVGEIKKTQDENGNWIIDIPLEYKPDSFDIEFSVEMEEGTPEALYPEAVIVKLAFWNGSEWEIISQQKTTGNTARPGVRVDIDSETGKGSGSYPVWKYDTDNEPYGYRAVITGYIYQGSTIIVPSQREHSKPGDLIVYSDDNYTTTMDNLSDGKNFKDNDDIYFNGAYYNDATGKQQGTLHGVISVEKYNVTFDAQGGINAQGKDKAENVYRIPDLADYVPTMGNHKFLGWYINKECTLPATSGELLVEDITLYAKWDRILSGEVIADAHYKNNGNEFAIDEADRATHALIELEEITPDGTYNIDGVIVEFEYEAGEHFSNPVAYEFRNLNPDKTYRVDVYLMNYETAYQNVTTPKDADEDLHNDYDAESTHNYYMAVYNDEHKYETNVNMLLKFKPENYVQNVVINAERIGKESLRPTSALVKYFSEETGVVDDYVLIVQHKDVITDDNVIVKGVQVNIDAATGTNDGKYGEEVWKKNYTGNLYNYQAYLASLNGGKVEDFPVTVTYGESARWSPINQDSTSDLYIELMPLAYRVTYDWNTGDGYKEVADRGHVWSYDSALNYSIPYRKGYVFLGWYSNPEGTGDKMDVVPAEVHEDVTVYAKWKKIDTYTLEIRHVDTDTDEVLLVEYKRNQEHDTIFVGSDLKQTEGKFIYYNFINSYPDNVKLEDINGNYVITLNYKLKSVDYAVRHYLSDGEGDYYELKDYSKLYTGKIGDYVTATPIESDDFCLNKSKMEESSVVLNLTDKPITLKLYYDFDSIGGGEDGNQSDDIPDKYQKRVQFRVVNGTWADGSYNDIVKVVTLTENGRWGQYGTADVEVPTGMIPSEGYEKGQWNVALGKTVTVSGNDVVIYTFTFDAIPDYEPEIPEGGIEGDGSGNGSGDIEGDTTHTIVFGKTNAIGWYNVSLDGGETYQIVQGNSTLEVEMGTEIIVKASNPFDGSFTFYVNGDIVKPNENGEIRVLVDGALLIGAWSIEIEDKTPEESLNWFQKIIKAIKDFFAKLFGKNK